MGWIHETRLSPKKHDPLAVASANMAERAVKGAMKAFDVFEKGESPEGSNFRFSHSLGLFLFDGVYPALLYRKGGEIVEIRSNDELFPLWEQIRVANEAEAEVEEATEAFAAGMSFHFRKGMRAVSRRFPEFAERIGNAIITSNGEDLRMAAEIHGYLKVGEEVVFALTGETRKTRGIKTGEEIILNTLTGEMYFHSEQVAYEEHVAEAVVESQSAKVTAGPVLSNNPFAALLKK